MVRLLEFSLLYKCELAVDTFPMFSRVQIWNVYAMSEEQRATLLKNRAAEHGAPRDRRSSAQKTKSRNIATDPSNR